MEHVHGVDVSWMTYGSPRDKSARIPQRRNTIPSSNPRDSPPSSPQSASPAASALDGNVDAAPQSQDAGAAPKPIPGARPGIGRSGSSEKLSNGAVGTSPQRRGSWFSNISSKFSGSGGGGAGSQSPPQANNVPPKQGEISVPRANPAKNAVLQHATRHDGDEPYTPAPPKSSQPGLLQVLRRLSSSSGGGGGGGGGGLGNGLKKNHGLVERRVLNVDPRRERCSLEELNNAKLRRVSFCVDVEIAPMPKYSESEAGLMSKVCGTTPKRRLSEKGEGEVLRNAKPAEEVKSPTAATENNKDVATTPAAAAAAADDATANAGSKDQKATAAAAEVKETAEDGGKEPNADVKAPVDATKKKEKKKKSEEERKARKEKKRKLAEVNGTIPMEIHLDSDSSGSTTADNGSAPRTQSVPTTNPVRIYRRCCQLRETPILKKITEQLSKPGNVSTAGGVVEKLDLTSYWLQLPDLVTLGDYLAVVPVKEVVLENCGLNDEGLRVILAGLLASKRPQKRTRKSHDGEPDGFVMQGGFVERLVLRNNKIGPEGWKHLCLFIYMCRSLKHLDISNLPLPRAAAPPAAKHHSITGNSRPPPPLSICQLLAKSLENRLAGSTLELLNMGETGPDMDQLGILVDGIIRCGVKRLGLAHNGIDAAGCVHVARYLASGMCEGLDLGGNDVGDQLEVLAGSLTDDSPLAAISLAECNLKPASLCLLFPKLIKLKEFRFLDLSHNQELFRTSPSAISLLRRYLPKMACMKRIHLADVSMISEQAIALAEVLPEVKGLAHINLLENPELAKLADAKTEESQEEACALYASLLAATRVSPSIVAVDIDVPTEQSGEIVKALAKQVVAYCLRNMDSLPLGNPATGEAAALASPRYDPEYPDVLQHLVGHDVLRPDDMDDADAAPDDDYVIGGTGVVKALACCLKNRGDESRRTSGEFVREAEEQPSPATPSRAATPDPAKRPKRLQAGKAKDMSKHLLGSARKIRHRLQPAMAKAKVASTNSAQDAHTYQRLLFLDRTLDGIIKRFEDEFPDTREFAVLGDGRTAPAAAAGGAPPSMPLSASFGSEAEHAGAGSDGEDEEDLLARPAISRTNSIISMNSKGLTNEEGRVLRAGHKFRSGWMMTQQHYDLLSAAVEEIGADVNHVRILHELLEEVDDPELNVEIAQKGVLAVFRDQRERICERLRSSDPEHWERFVESQRMARANVRVDGDGASGGGGGSGGASAGGGDGGVADGDINGKAAVRPRVDAAAVAASDEVAVGD